MLTWNHGLTKTISNLLKVGCNQRRGNIMFIFLWM